VFIDSEQGLGTFSLCRLEMENSIQKGWAAFWRIPKTNLSSFFEMKIF
jgi:hypothetical protein